MLSQEISSANSRTTRGQGRTLTQSRADEGCVCVCRGLVLDPPSHPVPPRMPTGQSGNTNVCRHNHSRPNTVRSGGDFGELQSPGLIKGVDMAQQQSYRNGDPA